MTRPHGFMLPVAITVALFVLIFSLGGSYLLNTNLRIGGNLKGNTIARYASEAGLEHAIGWLQVRLAANQLNRNEAISPLSVTQSNQGSYSVSFSWSGGTLTVTSVGTGPRSSEYQSRLVLSINQGNRQNPLFGQGWIAGNRIELNGVTNVQGARIHGDLGFASLSGTTSYSNDGVTWANIKDMVPSSIPISGARGVNSQLCSTSTPNNVVCLSGIQMYNQFCPIFQTAAAATTCDDLSTATPSLVDAATTPKVTAPSVNTLASTATGGAITNLVSGDPVNQAPGICNTSGSGNTFTFNSVTGSMSSTTLSSLLSSTGRVMGGDPRRVLCLRLTGGATQIIITGTLNLSNYRLVVNVPLTLPSTSTLSSFDIISSRNLTLNGVAASNSKFYSGGAITLSNSAQFTGNSTLASRNALTFNGNANMQAEKGLAIISESSVTFNGASGIKSLIWAGSNITFNGGTGGDTAYEGGAVAIGNIVRNGSANYILRANSSIENTDLPQTNTQPSIDVISRR